MTKLIGSAQDIVAQKWEDPGQLHCTCCTKCIIIGTEHGNHSQSDMDNHSVTPVYRGWLCFCTSSYAAATACRRFLFMRWFLTTLILDFFHFWHDCWPWPIDYLIRFWLIFVVTLTLNSQGQIWNLLYLSQKWSDCHGMKSEHINWILGLKCDHRVWPWPLPWPWIFKVKYRICCISAKNGLIATICKANISIELKASNVTTRFDLGNDLDLEFSRSNAGFPQVRENGKS